MYPAAGILLKVLIGFSILVVSPFDFLHRFLVVRLLFRLSRFCDRLVKGPKRSHFGILQLTSAAYSCESFWLFLPSLAKSLSLPLFGTHSLPHVLCHSDYFLFQTLADNFPFKFFGISLPRYSRHHDSLWRRSGEAFFNREMESSRFSRAERGREGEIANGCSLSSSQSDIHQVRTSFFISFHLFYIPLDCLIFSFRLPSPQKCRIVMFDLSLLSDRKVF